VDSKVVECSSTLVELAAFSASLAKSPSLRLSSVTRHVDASTYLGGPSAARSLSPRPSRYGWAAIIVLSGRSGISITLAHLPTMAVMHFWQRKLITCGPVSVRRGRSAPCCSQLCRLVIMHRFGAPTIAHRKSQLLKRKTSVSFRTCRHHPLCVYIFMSRCRL